MSESKDSESKDDVVKDSDEGKDGEEPLSDPDVKVGYGCIIHGGPCASSHDRDHPSICLRLDDRGSVH
jgi:hypothetical protein